MAVVSLQPIQVPWKRISQVGHLNASLRDKVDILAKNPCRFYIYPSVWTFRGPTRLAILSQFLTEAEAAEDFELCARILEVEKALKGISK